MNRIEFRIEEYDAGHTVCQCAVPFVDGVSILGLVTDFESSKGWDHAGAYAGIATTYMGGRRWIRSLLGEGHPEYEGDGITWLLGCACTVAECWPLEARVTIDANTVTWNSFRQPFRQRDYSEFGPFTLDRREYEAAIAHLAESLSIDLTAGNLAPGTEPRPAL